MIKYLLIKDGVRDRETSATIPIANGNRHYKEYLAWLDAGNTPVPMAPEPASDHVLTGDEWVLDTIKQNFRILSEKQQELEAKTLELFEFTYALFTVLKDKNVIVNTDFEQELRQKAAAWKALLDEIAGLA